LTGSLVVLSFLFLSCLPKTEPPNAVPVLPATSAPLYTRAPGTSPDPVVAALAADLPWDETLSGAAGALALSHSKHPLLEGHEVQWAAYRAGWPHPLLSFGIEQVDEGELPTRLLTGLKLSKTSHIGLARARNGRIDTWVLLVGEVLVDLAPFARHHAVGDALSIKWPADVVWTHIRVRAASPSGQVLLGPTFRMEEPGEWVVEVQQVVGDRTVDLARAPIYVGVLEPSDAPLELDRSLTTGGAKEIQRLATDGLDALRHLVEAPSLTPEPMLETSARKALSEWINGEGISDPVARMAGLGYGDSPVAELRCHAVSINACLDDLYWSVDSRIHLLDPSYDNVGVAGGTREGNVMLVVDLGHE
jgi:hypothetical protein